MIKKGGKKMSQDIKETIFSEAYRCLQRAQTSVINQDFYTNHFQYFYKQIKESGWEEEFDEYLKKEQEEEDSLRREEYEDGMNPFKE